MMKGRDKMNRIDIFRKDYELMSPKIDFVFKLIFGDPKNKDILIPFLRDVAGIAEEDFEEIEYMNSELLKDFQEERKGILDVRVKNRYGEQINIEIQVVHTKFMTERSLFYLSKMFTSNIKVGDSYTKLRKCIAINIVDFKCIAQDKLYSCYRFKDRDTGHELTDKMEIYFLELPKTLDASIERDERDPV